MPVEDFIEESLAALLHGLVLVRGPPTAMGTCIAFTQSVAKFEVSLRCEIPNLRISSRSSALGVLVIQWTVEAFNGAIARGVDAAVTVGG